MDGVIMRKTLNSPSRVEVNAFAVLRTPSGQEQSSQVREHAGYGAGELI